MLAHKRILVKNNHEQRHAYTANNRSAGSSLYLKQNPLPILPMLQVQPSVNQAQQ